MQVYFKHRELFPNFHFVRGYIDFMADIYNDLSHEPYKCTVKFMSDIKYLAKKFIYPTKKSISFSDAPKKKNEIRYFC